MKAEERQHLIEEYINNVEFASLEELAKHLEVSTSTVRRDLNTLESGGTIRRTHGGARLVNPKSDEFAFTARDTHELDEKELIGVACAYLIRPGQTVIIDAGTTAYHAAKHLQEKPLQIVTNSLPVANLFTSAQMTEVIVTGGVIYPRLEVMVGPLAVKAFSEIHADVAVMGAGGITLDGLTNSHALLIDIQRAMMKSAGKRMFLLDHTKFDRKSVAFLCGLEAVSTVITDYQAPAGLVADLRQKGVQVLVVSQNGEVDAGVAETMAEREADQPTAQPVAEEPEAAVSMVGWD